MRFIHLSLIALIASCVLAACNSRKPAQAEAVQASAEDESYDLDDIQQAGEMIAVTISGPETYYQYRGEDMGLQYLLADNFARQAGVRLRMEMAQDTLEMVRLLKENKADVIAYPLSEKYIQSQGLSAAVGPDARQMWAVRSNAAGLLARLRQWYSPSVLDDERKVVEQFRARPRVTRQAQVQLLSRSKGIISQYDGLFVRYATQVGWDWRLLAAMCWQESAFDPRAVSWAGARGLMQIMPRTAAGMNVRADDLFDAETNVATSARYIKYLQSQFSDIRNPLERTKFVLASYNGGAHHVRDAMRLAQKNGRNQHLWAHVGYYVLHLSEARYYRDPDVKYGYMIGSETYNYVNQIMDRWNRYRGAVKGMPAVNYAADPSKSSRKNRFSQPSEIKGKDEFLNDSILR